MVEAPPALSEKILNADKFFSPENRTDPKVIRLAYGDWEPYSGKTLAHNGCDSWVISEAFAQEGYSVVYGYFPWKRAYQLAQDGVWDGTFEWADTPEHRQSFYFSADYTSSQRWVFFFRKDRPLTWENMDSLEGLSVGLTGGYVYSGAFDDLIKRGTVNFEEAPSDEINLRKVLNGRIDVFPLEIRVGYSLLNQNFSLEEKDQITSSPVPFDVFLPYLLLTKKNTENIRRMEAFDRGFKLIKQSGRYDYIMNSCSPKNQSFQIPTLTEPTLGPS